MLNITPINMDTNESYNKIAESKNIKYNDTSYSFCFCFLQYCGLNSGLTFARQALYSLSSVRPNPILFLKRPKRVHQKTIRSDNTLNKAAVYKLSSFSIYP
jgi:hypothetical protein